MNIIGVPLSVFDIIAILTIIAASFCVYVVLKTYDYSPNKLKKQKAQQLYPPVGEYLVSIDVIYQEAYEEGRRHRDHELNISIWYTSLLTAIAGAIFAAKYTAPACSSISHILSCYIVQLVLTIISFFIAFSGIYSVLYSHQRYSQEREFLDKIEPSWESENFKNYKIILTPRHLIIITQVILFVLIFLVIWLLK